MNAISPGVYSRITVLESYVEEVPSSTGFVAIISDKGEDSKLKFVTSREQFLKETGKPNVNKYGVRWAHGSLIGERFTAASPSLFYIRCLPDDATYSTLAFWLLRRPKIIITDTITDPNTLTWSEIQYINDNVPAIIGKHAGQNTYYRYFGYEGFVGGLEDITNIDVIENNFTESHFKQLPEVYLQGIDSGTGTVYTFRLYQDNLQLISTSAPNVEPVFVLGDNGTDIYYIDVEIVPSGSGGYPIQGTNLEATLRATSIATYNAANDSVPTRYVKNYNGNQIFEIHVDNTGNVTFNDVTATYSGDAYEFIKPLFVLRGTGRGSYYNNYKIEFTPVVNKEKTYNFTIFELKEDNQYHSIGSYYVSFDSTVLDESGESLFISNVIGTYVDDIKIWVDEDNMEENRREVNLDIINNIVSVPKISEYRYASGVYEVEDMIDMLPTNPLPGTYYFVKTKAASSLYGYDGKIIKIDTTAPNGFVDIEDVDPNMIILNKSDNKYYLHLGLGVTEQYDPFVHYALMESNENDDLENRKLEYGSEGSLIDNTTGQVDPNIATTILVNAYMGLTDNLVLSKDNIWIDLVFCGAYPREVEDAAVELCKLRQDCIMIGDLGDNPNLESALKKRIEEYYYNTFLAALFEPFRLIRDPFSGKDIWVSPVYHMAYLIAQNDRINEVWYAVAGFTRGMADGIKELRYDPELSDRDQMYLNQINPTAHFKEGKVVWGQLTTQRKADAMQDINIVRCILYIKRALENFCRYFNFDFNDALTWLEIENGIKAFLKDVQEKRGLYSYDASVYADEYMKKRKSARASIILEPTRILEKIYLDFNIK